MNFNIKMSLLTILIMMLAYCFGCCGKNINTNDEVDASDSMFAFNLRSEDSELSAKILIDNKLYITGLSAVSENNNMILGETEVAMPLRYILNGVEDEFEWVYTSYLTINDKEKGYGLIFSDNKIGCEYQLFCTSHTDTPGPFEFRGEFRNNGNEIVTIVPSVMFDITVRGGNPTAWYFAKESGVAEGFVQSGGGITSGTGIYQKNMENGKAITAWSNLYQNWNANGYIPMIYLDYESEYGVYAALEWPAGRVSAKANETTVTLFTDMDGVSPSRDAFKTAIIPGGTFYIPSTYLGVYSGSVDDGANIFKTWYLKCKAPVCLLENENEPFAQMDFQVSIDSAASYGLQSVKWDYGWWSNNITVAPWRTLEGSWMVRNSDYFGVLSAYSCETISDFSALLKANGLTLTAYLLLHDTNINEYGDVSTDFGEFNSITHPDWFSNRRVTDGMGLSADLGNENCVAYLKKALKEFLSSSGVTTWRSDFEPICYFSDKKNRHADYGTDVQYWCATGFYDLVDYLYQSVPDFRYESCSSGGSMKDFATMRRAVIINNDDSANYLSLRMSFYDSSYCFSPAQLQIPYNIDTSFTLSEDYYYPKIESSILNSEAIQNTVLVMGLRTAILGVPMFSSWSNTKYYGDYYGNEIAKYTEYYNDRIKPLQKNGGLYHILPRPDGVNWDGVMYANKDASSELKGAAFLFKPSESVENSYKVVMNGLYENKIYSLVFEDRTEQNCHMNGAEMMTTGIEVIINAIGSEIIWIYED